MRKSLVYIDDFSKEEIYENCRNVIVSGSIR